MNIIEAIKSGKRFRRKSWKANEMTWISQDLGDLPLQLTRGDIVADDWELKEEPVTITRTQFFEAYAHAVAELPSNPTNSSVLEMMADRLGL